MISIMIIKREGQFEPFHKGTDLK